MLSDDTDEVRQSGGRTKRVRFSPRAIATKPLLHQFCEQSHLITAAPATAHPSRQHGVAEQLPNPIFSWMIVMTLHLEGLHVVMTGIGRAMRSCWCKRD